jgi:hypothetical protein
VGAHRTAAPARAAEVERWPAADPAPGGVDRHLFLLKSGLSWEMLSQEMGCGSEMMCWRRLRDWQAAGIWDRLHRILLDRLGGAHALD